MAKIKLDPPLLPRRGSVVQVLIICRVSDPGPGKQDIKSNEDQEAEFTKWVKDRVDSPIAVNVIAGSGSGEFLDRAESEQAQAELASEKYDLVIAEDLGRIFRRLQAFLFCEEAEDVGTRVIAPNDHLDTTHEDWRLCAFFAAMRHEMYNADNSKRIRRTLRNRFQQGHVVQFVIAGYIKPQKVSAEDNIHDSQVVKDPVAEPVYDEWFSMLERGATFSEVADWLNAIGFPPGPHCNNEEWDGRMVARTTRNPILKGIRVRNDRMSKRINKTGRRISVKAPKEERLERSCPHLAFIEPKRYDRVIRMLKERNAKYQRKDDANEAAKKRGPRKRTRWPGQHLYCSICRHMFVWGGHGQTDRLMCDGCRHYRCWQAITVNGPLASQKLTEAIFAKIETLPGFDPYISKSLCEEVGQRNDRRTQRLRELDDAIRQTERELNNVVAFIRDGKSSCRLADELDRLEAKLDDLEQEREQLANQPQQVPSLPAIDDIKHLAREAMARHADDPYAFGKLMRTWIPKIEVYPYRLFDGGQIVLRAHFQLHLASLVPQAMGLEGISQPLSTSLVVDLFDSPNQRDRFRQQVVQLKRQRFTEKQIAERLKITKTAVQRAVALQRQIDELGIIDPYVPLTEPPEDYTKLRRHKHPRYQFRPLAE